ncbi:MAG: hypothetical protein LUD50_06320 [Clostridia bacterium]|nr:hypothetical protein [Clostridia bacterium]
MVDLLANKTLRGVILIIVDKITDIIRDMFDKYLVNQSTLMRYARRRNKEQEVREILGDRLDAV